MSVICNEEAAGCNKHNKRCNDTSFADNFGISRWKVERLERAGNKRVEVNGNGKVNTG